MNSKETTSQNFQPVSPGKILMDQVEEIRDGLSEAEVALLPKEVRSRIESEIAEVRASHPHGPSLPARMVCGNGVENIRKANEAVMTKLFPKD